ncbi:MAG: phosphate ABC transporter substrate-binding protein [Spirochaetaceae bacterium]|jgi:phosphate transport system substrate-binding protein|nr:phosphate ABC transporter substrate-binding protein [Spirochaetaceae bacterium]
MRTGKQILIALSLAAINALAVFAGGQKSAAKKIDVVFAEKSGTIDISGGTAHIPVMRDAARNIMEAYPDIRITVSGGGSGVGVQQVGEGLVQIGNTGRSLKPDEVEKYGLKTFPFAIDGVAAAVNPANMVKALSKEQVKKIFAGEITNWNEIGGADANINVYIREDGSGTRETFEELALEKGSLSAKANVVNSNGAMKTAIAQDKNAIGYVSIGHLDNSVAGVTFDGMAPTQTNAKDGSYKVTRLLYMNTKGEPAGITKSFIDYIYSPEGKDITTAAGYIPVDKEN